jgi:flavin reductase (DIM6/NTAB) family NADH-FMN oxidoreductase RutF
MEAWLGSTIEMPMLIVTVAANGRRAGCLVGFGTQCSIEPLRFIAFLSVNNRTYEIAKSAEILAVHAVPADRRDLAELFGALTGDDVDKFERTEWRPGPKGVPVLQGCGSWFAGRIVDRVAAGDHVGFVLEPVEGQAGRYESLTLQDVADMEPGHEP